MSKVITFYNHKGGVAKTTNIFNLSYLLAANGKKTLVIDADPQCNATELFLAPMLEKLDIEEIKTGQEQTINGTSLLDILNPRIEGSSPEVDIDKAQVISVSTNLDLIKGDVALSSIEDALSEAHSQRHATKIHERRTYCALGDFLTRFGTKNAYEYIIIDVGPSSGSLTRSCFLACDAFFIPVNPDRFDVQAIVTLSSIVDRWMAEHAEIYEDFKSIGLPVKIGRPQFLGLTIQNLKMNGGKPKPGFKLWIERIPQKTINNLFPVLRKYSTETHNMLNGIVDSNVIAAEVPDFGSLAPVMQEYGKPVFEINQDDTKSATEGGQAWSGATWKDAVERMGKYKKTFEQMMARLELIK